MAVRQLVIGLDITTKVRNDGILPKLQLKLPIWNQNHCWFYVKYLLRFWQVVHLVLKPRPRMTFTISHISYSWVFVVFSRTFRRPPALDAKGLSRRVHRQNGVRHLLVINMWFLGKTIFFLNRKNCFVFKLTSVNIGSKSTSRIHLVLGIGVTWHPKNHPSFMISLLRCVAAMSSRIFSKLNRRPVEFKVQFHWL